MPPPNLIYEERQKNKERNVAYREAAALFTGTAVNLHGTVYPMQDGSGAFVEVNVWVPRAAIEPSVNPCYDGHIWPNQFGEDWTPVDGTPCACKQKTWNGVVIK